MDTLILSAIHRDHEHFLHFQQHDYDCGTMVGPNFPPYVRPVRPFSPVSPWSNGTVGSTLSSLNLVLTMGAIVMGIVSMFSCIATHVPFVSLVSLVVLLVQGAFFFQCHNAHGPKRGIRRRTKSGLHLFFISLVLSHPPLQNRQSM